MLHKKTQITECNNLKQSQTKFTKLNHFSYMTVSDSCYGKQRSLRLSDLSLLFYLLQLQQSRHVFCLVAAGYQTVHTHILCILHLLINQSALCVYPTYILCYHMTHNLRVLPNTVECTSSNKNVFNILHLVEIYCIMVKQWSICGHLKAKFTFSKKTMYAVKGHKQK